MGLIGNTLIEIAVILAAAWLFLYWIPTALVEGNARQDAIKVCMTEQHATEEECTP
jgi:hypothetical protein